MSWFYAHGHVHGHGHVHAHVMFTCLHGHVVHAHVTESEMKNEEVVREQKNALFALREKATVTGESHGGRFRQVRNRPAPNTDTTLWPAAV